MPLAGAAAVAASTLHRPATKLPLQRLKQRRFICTLIHQRARCVSGKWPCLADLPPHRRFASHALPATRCIN